MRCEQSTEGEWVVLSIEGDLDHRAAPQLTQRIRELAEAGSHRIVLDLTGIRTVTATGTTALVRGLRAARAAGGDLRLAADPVAERLLTTHHVARVFRIHSSVSEAIVHGTPTSRRLSQQEPRRTRRRWRFSPARRGRA